MSATGVHVPECSIDPDVPVDEGSYRPIEMTAPDRALTVRATAGSPN